MGVKKDKLPKGVGRLPEWWLEVTPHDTLFLRDEETKKREKEEEEKKFAKLAALQDLYEKYGGEGFPDWNPSTDGPRTKEEEEEWVSKGYKRNEQNQWVSETDTPLEGRQFEGRILQGCKPGEFGLNNGTGTTEEGEEGVTLKSTKYERDNANTWDKPDWMKVKLRTTDSGGAIRHGDVVDRPIVKSDGTIVHPTKSTEEGLPLTLIDDNPESEDWIDHNGRELGDIKGAAEFKPRATGELQAILNRRKQASD